VPLLQAIGFKSLVPKKGLEPSSFSNPFSLKKIAATIEYTSLSDFAMEPTGSTASSNSIRFCSLRTPQWRFVVCEWTPHDARFREMEQICEACTDRVAPPDIPDWTLISPFCSGGTVA
jgi:hypothetical protein